jgi:hypothetical protein
VSGCCSVSAEGRRRSLNICMRSLSCECCEDMFWRPKREREMYFFLRCRGRGVGAGTVGAVAEVGTVAVAEVGVGGERSLRPEEEEEGPEVRQMMIGEEVARESAEDDGSCILIFFVN